MQALQSEVNRVLSTREYSLFRYEPKPKFYEKKLMILIGEMGLKNLSKDIPIIIDKEYNILDGVYRYEANKALNEPIFYKIAEVANQLDLMKAGALVHNPTDFEFIYYHRDKLAYRKVLEWCKLLPYSYRDIIGIFPGKYLTRGAHQAKNKFKDGLMEYSKQDDFKLKRIQEFITSITDKHGYVPMSIETVIELLEESSYKVPKCVEKLSELIYFKEFLQLYTEGHPEAQDFDNYIRESKEYQWKKENEKIKDVYAKEEKYGFNKVYEDYIFPLLVMTKDYFGI